MQTKSQQQKFIEGLLLSAQSKEPVKQKQSIKINYYSNTIEVNNNCNGFLVYRVNNGLWNSLNSFDEIEYLFKNL